MRKQSLVLDGLWLVSKIGLSFLLASSCRLDSMSLPQNVDNRRLATSVHPECEFVGVLIWWQQGLVERHDIFISEYQWYCLPILSASWLAPITLWSSQSAVSLCILTYVEQLKGRDRNRSKVRYTFQNHLSSAQQQQTLTHKTALPFV
jgi:hypothetical protein